jgi:hypothetical protein
VLVAIRKAMTEKPAIWLPERTHLYAASVGRRNEQDRSKYIPYPATWFNRGSYDDDLKSWERDYSNSHQQKAPTAEDHVRDGWR